MLAMGKTGIKKLVIKKDSFELHLEREEKAGPRTYDASLENFDDNPLRGDFEKMRSQNVVSQTEREGLSSHLPGLHSPSSVQEDEVNAYVTSPMVGTIYYAASPQDAPFVKVGDTVEKSTVVCIIEAMKVMNEVKAGVSGKIAEILVDNGHPIEFGTKLFRIIPTV